MTILYCIHFQHDSELFGRTLRVNLAKPLRIKEGSTRPVWADEEWLQMYAGKKDLETNGAEEKAKADPAEAEDTKATSKRQAQDAIEMGGVSVAAHQSQAK